MIACVIISYLHYPKDILKLIIDAQFAKNYYEYREIDSRLYIYIFNVDLFEVLDIIEQFNEAEMKTIFGYGFGHSKQEARKFANMKILVNKNNFK